MKKSSSRGFTLMELMIVVSIIATIVIGLGWFAKGCLFSSRETAEEEATKWAQESGLKDPRVSCAKLDTDNDGYVSCTVTVTKQNGDPQIIPVECAAKFSLNDGCRNPKFGVQER